MDICERSLLLYSFFGTLEDMTCKRRRMMYVVLMVSAEIALSFLSYHLRRAINILGVGVLIARINERKRKTEG